MSGEKRYTRSTAGLSTRSTASKRDSFQAELDKDPHLSTAKRQQRTTTFTNQLATASLERRLLTSETARLELEKRLAERDATITALEADRRFLADREKEEREEKEALEEQINTATEEKERELRDLRRKTAALREEHADLQDVYSALKRQAIDSTNSQSTQLDTLTRQVAFLESELLESKNIADERARKVKELEERLEQEGEERDADADAELDEDELQEHVPMSTTEVIGRSLEVSDSASAGLPLPEGGALLSSTISASAGPGPSSATHRRRSRRGTPISTQTTQNTHDWTILRAELTRQQTHLRALESTNTRQHAELILLRARDASIEVLKEQKRELEMRLLGLDEMRERVVRLEGELDAARKERDEWAAKGARKAEASAALSDTPVSITAALSSLRLTHASLLETHGSTVAQLHQRERELLDVNGRADSAEKAVETLKAELDGAREAARRKAGEKRLLERDVVFLKSMLASYEAEAAQSSSSSGEVKAVTTSGMDEAKLARLRQLEEDATAHQSTIRSLEAQVDALGGAAVLAGHRRSFSEIMSDLEKERTAKETIQRALDEAQGLAKTHLDKIEELEQTLWDLRGDIGGGRHVPPNTRILTLKQNPLQDWVDLRQAVLDRLKSENEALLKRLADLEASGARAKVEDEGKGNKDLVPRESYDAISSERDELQAAAAQKDKRLLRLQQVFQAKSAEFREAIASILGLKFAFYPNGQVRVTSMYDLNASFVFAPVKNKSHQSSPQGPNAENTVSMELIAVGESQPEDLDGTFEYWVRGEQCIPGFMASVTLECYDKVKRQRE